MSDEEETTEETAAEDRTVLDGGSFDVEAVVGIDKGRKLAKGMIRISAAQPSVVSAREDAITFATNILAACEVAYRDELKAQAMIDSGEMNVDEIENGQGIR